MIATISLCYNQPDVIYNSVRRYYETTTQPTRHILFDAQWPLERTKMDNVLKTLHADYGCEIHNIGQNMGLARNFNHCLSLIDLDSTELVVAYDPDSWPMERGWDQAMLDVIRSRANAAWISLWHPHAQRELLGENRGAAEGNLVWATSAVMNSVSGFRPSWLKACGGLYEINPFYGGVESNTWDRLAEHGMRWVFLRDYTEVFWPKPELLNSEYRDYKFQTTHGGKKQVEFSEWLRAKGLL